MALQTPSQTQTHPLPTLALFGSTGGCLTSLLHHALQAGYPCRALARTPSALTTTLLASGIPQSTLSTHLTIIKGDIRNPDDVTNVLQKPTGGCAEIVLSGIGSYPELGPWTSGFLPRAKDPKLCGEGMEVVLGCVKGIQARSASTSTGAAGEEGGQGQGQGRKPLVVAISTTGISDVQRDVPLSYVFLYKVLLHQAHVDKKVMEGRLFATSSSSSEPDINWTIVRPTLLTSGAPRGADKVRSGWEEPMAEGLQEKKGKGPAIGFMVSRADVGGWIFEKVVKGWEERTGKSGWEGRCVSLTY